MEVGLQEPIGLLLLDQRCQGMQMSVVPTNKAPLTDSSHKSRMNTSSAIDSLSMEMTR